MFQRKIAISSISLDPLRDPIRLPLRPFALRYNDFEDLYDFTTLFYDVFQESPDRVRIIAPPLLNLRDDLALTIVALPSHTPCDIRLRRLRCLNELIVQVPVGTTALEVNTTLGAFYCSVQPNLSFLFQDRRVVFTLDLIDDLTWFKDWVRFYHRQHSCSGVLIYHNRTDGYPEAEIEAAIKSIDPNISAVVLSWPFKYGVFDVRRQLTIGLIDSLFCQPAALEHARRRFLTTARSVLNVDIDELVIGGPPQSIFEAVERSSSGYAVLSGRWVYPNPGGNSGITAARGRHKDHWHVKQDPLDICESKWAVVPSRCLDYLQWDIHLIPYMPDEGASAAFQLRHFKPINVNWDVDAGLSENVRTDAGKAAKPDDLIPDEALRTVLQTVFAESELRQNAEPASVSTLAQAYRARIRSSESNKAVCIDSALAAAREACDLLPEHPGFQRYLAELLGPTEDGADARGCLDRANYLQLRDSRYHFQLGRVAYWRGEFSVALEYFERAVLRDANAVAPYEGLFAIVQASGEQLRARQLLTDWLSRGDKSSEGEFLAARIGRARGNPAAAIQHARKALKSEPSPVLLYFLASCLLHDGQLEEAELHQRSAIRAAIQGRRAMPIHAQWPDEGDLDYHILSPKIPEHEQYGQLSEICLSRDDLVGALRFARKAAYFSEGGRFKVKLASILETLGRKSEAEGERKKGIALARNRLARRILPLVPFGRQLANENLFINVARVLYLADCREEAIAVLDSGLSECGASGRFGVLTAELLINLGERQLALGVLDAMPAEHVAGWAVRVNRLRGQIYFRLGDPKTAIDCFRAAVSIDPGEFHARLLLGNSLGDAGFQEEAIEALRAALQIEPKHEGAWRRLSVALSSLGRVGEAIEAVRQSLAINPASAASHHRLGILLEQDGRFEEAMEAQRTALRIDPKHEGAWRRLGMGLSRLGRIAEAIEAVRQSLVINPASAASHHQLGILLELDGRLDDALEAQRTALRIDPKHEGAWRRLGMGLSRLGRLAEAIEAVRQSLVINPASAASHHQLGILLERDGRLDQAEEAQRAALRIEPEHLGALHRLSTALSKAGRVELEPL